MAGDILLAVVEGLSLKGFHVYKDVWDPFKGEILLLEVEKKNKWGYPVGALRRSDKETVGHAGIEYHAHLRRLIRLGCHCTAIVQNPKTVRFKPIPLGGEEIMCDYRAEGPDNQATRQILLQLLHELGKPELQHIYYPKMKVKIKDQWLFGKALEEVLKPSVPSSDKSIPDELDDDPETRKLYEKAMETGVETDRTIRVMLIGCYGQGKTTLAKRLMGEPIEGIQSTDGIEVYRCKSKDKCLSTVWRLQNGIDDDTDKRIASAVQSLSSQDSSGISSISQSVSAFEDNALHDESAMDETTDEKDENCGSDVFDSIENSAGLSQDAGNSIVIHKRKHDESVDSGIGDTPANDKIDYNLRSRKKLKQNSELYKRFKTQLKNLDDLQERNISLWDFGGQYIYYATHQLFHAKNAVYLLVFNLSIPLDEEIEDEDFPGEMKTKTMRDYIKFWISSIHSFVGSHDGKEPRVILVGTFRDRLKNDEEAEQYFEKVKDLFANNNLRYHIDRHVMLSLTVQSDKNIEVLKRAIEEIGSRSEAEQKVPLRWIYLEKELQEHTSKNIVSFKELLEIDNDSVLPIASEKGLKLFLKYHHSRGKYFYFDEVEIGNHVVLNPDYIIKAFRSVIKSKRFCQDNPDLVPFWQELSGKAILKKQLMQVVWKKNLPGCNEQVLKLLLQKHRIIARVNQYDKTGDGNLKPLDFYIVPSLLKYSDRGKIEEFTSRKGRTEISLVYEFEYIGVVETVFQRTLAASCGTWPVVYFGPTLMLFDNGGVFELDSYHAGVIKRNENKIELLVVSFVSKKGICQGKGDYFRRFVEFIIKNEFSKLKNEPLESQMFKTKGRCFHKSHNERGSLQLFAVDMRNKDQIETVRCPDSFSHSLQLRDVANDWFDEEISDKDFPKKKLSLKQCHTLAQAIVCDLETLGDGLGLRNSQIQRIKMENQNTVLRIYYMLLQWNKQYPDEATLDVLVKVLLKLPRETVEWDIFKNMKDDLF